MKILRHIACWLLCAALVIAPAQAQSGLGMTGVSAPPATSSCAYDTDACTLFAAMNTAPSSGRKTIYSNYIAALKADGIWTKCDARWVLAAGESQTSTDAQQAAKLNIVHPGTYNLTAVNSPAFTNDQGFTGAATKYLDTNFNPSTATSPNFTQNSAAVAAWSLTSASVTGATFGLKTGTTSSIETLPRWTGDIWYGGLNSAAEATIAGGQTDGSGLRLLSRTSSANFVAYSGSTVVATVTDASVTVKNINVVLLNEPAFPAPYTGTVAFAEICSGMNGTQEGAEYARIHTLLQAIAGVP